MNARNYREHLYHQRAHPLNESVLPVASDNTLLYLSIFPFTVAEYFLELKYQAFPSGLLFPGGFLFFWAFYYTYYQPGHLEKQLSSESKWELSGILATLMGSCIWFVKIVSVELIEKLIFNYINPKQKVQKTRFEPRKNSFKSIPIREKGFKSSQSFSDVRPHNIELLPKDLTNALGIMGIPHERDWGLIQKRYRDLAKKYHPDLNPELTQAGNRFILVDAAYRKLETSKYRFFNSKKT